MSTEIIPNPSAFPQWDGHSITGEPQTLIGGMSLRDYFAASAASAIVCRDWFNDKSDCDALAKQSYKLADAMLKARLL